MKFNKYDPNVLKQLQQLELTILKDFIKICNENNLEYSMYGGSFLGAVRHHGFIPWDDDIDVMMSNKDYKKFLEIMSKENSNKYRLISPKNTENYFLLFSKLMLKGTKFEEWWIKQVDFNVGINIDIFCLLNVPNNKIKRWFYIKKARLLDRLITMSVIKLEDYPFVTQTIANFGHFILNLFNITPKKLKRKMNKLVKKYENEDTEYVCDICALNHPQIYKRKDIFPTKKIKFEDIEVQIANNYDPVLKIMYGDYMQIPPEEDRYNHVPYCLDFGPYSK